ncbi:MAG: RNA polymerase factor sigma-54 [Gammaproteobacteria bacterium]
MKQSLQLKLGQQLVMTPQLRQAIKLLQLSTLDLQGTIQEQLDSNLMLEVDEDAEPVADGADQRSEGPDSRDAGDTSDSSGDPSPASDDGPAEPDTSDSLTAASENMPGELPVDVGWEDIYDPSPGPYNAAPSDDNAVDYYEIAGAQRGMGLQEHLQWQLDMTPMSPLDRVIAEAIIDSIADDGYLRCEFDDIRTAVGSEEEVSDEEIEAVLHRVQHFDPAGVAARTPAECLTAQLDQLAPDTAYLAEARQVVSRFLDQLAARDLKTIMRRLKLDMDTLNEVIDIVRSLNPHPGHALDAKEPEYVVPDVFVSKGNGQWRVDLNPDTAPKLRINSQYAGLIRRGDNSKDNTYMRDHLQEARWFIKSLRSRNETLLKVASAIVDRQRAFLEQGDEAMVPLVLRDVAEAVEMHESTISRVTTQKYMHTPRGIYEFKYFFSSHVGTADGGECSATAIRAMIKKLCSEENPAKPLSDNKIAKILDERGIQVARRTVAKYRESMNIPPSNERKRLG